MTWHLIKVVIVASGFQITDLGHTLKESDCRNIASQMNTDITKPSPHYDCKLEPEQ